MQTIQAIQQEYATGPVKRLLETARTETGVTSNMVKTMAQSPNALEGYLQFSHALAGGKLSPKLRELIALTVAQANGSEYSLAEHTARARQRGLTEEEIQTAREGEGADAKTSALLQFVRDLALRRGRYSATDLREAGHTGEEIVQIVAEVALNVFANDINLVASTELDFPSVGRSGVAA